MIIVIITVLLEPDNKNSNNTYNQCTTAAKLANIIYCAKSIFSSVFFLLTPFFWLREGRFSSSSLLMLSCKDQNVQMTFVVWKGCSSQNVISLGIIDVFISFRCVFLRAVAVHHNRASSRDRKYKIIYYTLWSRWRKTYAVRTFSFCHSRKHIIKSIIV